MSRSITAVWSRSTHLGELGSAEWKGSWQSGRDLGRGIHDAQDSRPRSLRCEVSAIALSGQDNDRDAELQRLRRRFDSMSWLEIRSRELTGVDAPLTIRAAPAPAETTSETSEMHGRRVRWILAERRDMASVVSRRSVGVDGAALGNSRSDRLKARASVGVGGQSREAGVAARMSTVRWSVREHVTTHCVHARFLNTSRVPSRDLSRRGAMRSTGRSRVVGS